MLLCSFSSLVSDSLYVIAWPARRAGQQSCWAVWMVVSVDDFHCIMLAAGGLLEEPCFCGLVEGAEGALRWLAGAGQRAGARRQCRQPVALGLGLLLFSSRMVISR